MEVEIAKLAAVESLRKRASEDDTARPKRKNIFMNEMTQSTGYTKTERQRAAHCIGAVGCYSAIKVFVS